MVERVSRENRGYGIVSVLGLNDETQVETSRKEGKSRRGGDTCKLDIFKSVCMHVVD